MNEHNGTRKDRVLGDEWQDWNGNRTIENPDSRKTLFFSFAGIILLLFIISGFGIIFMISPRLEQFYQKLPVIFYIAFGVLSLYSIFTYAVISLALLTEKDIWIRLKRKNFLYNSVVPLVLNIANYFGISKDKISNSFIKVNNSIVKATMGKLTGDQPRCEKILILLPRCLQKEILKNVMNLKNEYNLDIYTVPGGTQARAIIQKTAPEAIIAVACERDLLTGIKDIAAKIPVIGIVNQRPEGPCKETLIDISEVEDAIKMFSGA